MTQNRETYRRCDVRVRFSLPGPRAPDRGRAVIRILLAVADPDLTGRLGQRFAAAFGVQHQLEVVGGARYALTSLERVRADLIVSGETLEDMDGRGLFDIICDDATLRRIPFILLSDSPANALLSASPETAVTLSARADPGEVLATAFALLLRSGRLGERAQGGTVKLSGTLEALTLFDIITSLKHGGRSGQLVVQFSDAEAAMQLRKGLLIHANFGRAVGEDAVTAIFTRAEREPEAYFRFESSAKVLAAQQLVTIDTPVDKLLVQVAVALDENRATV